MNIDMNKINNTQALDANYELRGSMGSFKGNEIVISEDLEGEDKSYVLVKELVPQLPTETTKANSEFELISLHCSIL